MVTGTVQDPGVVEGRCAVPMSTEGGGVGFGAGCSPPTVPVLADSGPQLTVGLSDVDNRATVYLAGALDAVDDVALLLLR